MQLVKTYQLNCESSEVATPENDTIRFDGYTLWPHCTFMSAMCYSFWKAQLLYQDNIISSPRKICILIDKNILYEKANKANKNTSFDQLEWFITNMETPKCGLVISVYSFDNIMTHIEDRWAAQTIWPLKKEWQWKGKGNYITLHDSEWKISSRKTSHAALHPTRDIIDNIEYYSEFPVKRINYRMTEEEIFTILRDSKFHLSYTGGTYYSAGMIGCPTLGLYWDDVPKAKVTYHEKDTLKEIETSVEFSMWNLGNSNSKGRVLQYDYESVFQRPQKYLKHVSRKAELLNYLKGYSDIEINGKIYEITN